MKRVLAIILFISLFFCSVSSVFAGGGTPLRTVEYYADGSYGVTVISEEEITRSTVQKSKSYNHYDENNVLLWTVKLTARFNYTGTTAVCTYAGTSHTIYDTAWQVTKSEPSSTGDTATGEFTVKKYILGVPVKTVNKTLTLTCTPSGVVY